MVTIKAFGSRATFDGRAWRSTDDVLLLLLTNRLRAIEGRTVPATGRVDVFVAHDAVEELRRYTEARILRISKQRGAMDPS
jgi:hypothetical protein